MPVLLPEFEGIRTWLHTPGITRADLLGKPALLFFWDGNCVSCHGFAREVSRRFSSYPRPRLTIIGVHSPSQALYPIDHLRQELKEAHIDFPIAADHERSYWQSMRNIHCPALYVLDREGHIVSQHIGRGGYHRIEAELRVLLAAN